MFPKIREIIAIAAVIGCFGSVSSEAIGQLSRPNPYAGRSGYNYNVRQQLRSNPTVSPYLTLVFNGAVTSNAGSVAPTYQTFVRPQVEQRENAIAQQRQLSQLQQQVSQIRSDYQAGQNGPIATGHPTRYQIHTHYYPQLDVR